MAAPSSPSTERESNTMKLGFKSLVLFTFIVALVFSLPAAANKPPKHPKPTCGVPHKPPCPQPPPAPPAPPPGPVCPPGQHPGGQDGQPGNDASCVPDEQPPPPPPPAEIAQPSSAALALSCPAGMTEIGRTPTQIICSKTVTVTKTVKGKTIIKKVKPKTKVKIVRYCPRKPNDHGLAG
jgi:hypothetical protein